MVTLLLVDDEPAVLEMMEVTCQEADYETLAAADGREALRLFFQHQPGLVITDIRMPVMDGFDLCRHIREISEVPIIVLSAMGEEEKSPRSPLEQAKRRSTERWSESSALP